MKSEIPQNVCLGEADLNRLLIEIIRVRLPRSDKNKPEKITQKNLSVAIYGKKGAYKWEQENPNFLYHLKDDEPRRVIKPGNAYMFLILLQMAQNFPEVTLKVFLMQWGISTKALLKL